MVLTIFLDRTPAHAWFTPSSGTRNDDWHSYKTLPIGSRSCVENLGRKNSSRSRSMPSNVVGQDWRARLDKSFQENLGKFRKYDGKSVQDLLRALRNKVSRLRYHLRAEGLTNSCRNTIIRTCPRISEGNCTQCPRDISRTSRVVSPTVHACSQCHRVFRFDDMKQCSGLILT
jgi:RNA polymerase-binding transcription factor DksA